MRHSCQVLENGGGGVGVGGGGQKGHCATTTTKEEKTGLFYVFSSGRPMTNTVIHLLNQTPCSASVFKFYLHCVL